MCLNSLYVAKCEISNQHQPYRNAVREKNGLFIQCLRMAVSNYMNLLNLDLRLGVSLGSLETVFGLLKVDDRPDVLEVVCRVKVKAVYVSV